MNEWQQLEEPWRECLEAAWEAFLAGTIPVGAVVANADGVIVARGRNRIFEPPGHGLSGSRLAHAEVDALAQLPTSARYRDHVLYSTLEPCLLCVAATLHATVGRIEYAAVDPFGGACTGTIDVGHWRRSAPAIEGPRDGWWAGRLSTALQSAFWQQHADHPKAAEIISSFGDDGRAAGARVVALENDLPEDFQAALPELLGCLSTEAL